MKWLLYFVMTILLVNGTLNLASSYTAGQSLERGIVQLVIAVVLLGIANVVDGLGRR